MNDLTSVTVIWINPFVYVWLWRAAHYRNLSTFGMNHLLRLLDKLDTRIEINSLWLRVNMTSNVMCSIPYTFRMTQIVGTLFFRLSQNLFRTHSQRHQKPDWIFCFFLSCISTLIFNLVVCELKLTTVFVVLLCCTFIYHRLPFPAFNRIINNLNFFFFFVTPTHKRNILHFIRFNIW